MTKKSVAIIIPTRNRSQYIKGLLNYYEQIGSHHPLYIGDCSDLEHFNDIKSSVDSLNEKIRVNLKHFPQYKRGIIDTCIVIKNLLNLVKEDFAVFAGDDDYFIPSALDKFISFLEKNKNYESVNGLGRFIKYDLKKNQSIISNEYNIHSYSSNSGAERLHSCMNSYSVSIYNVHRTTTLKKAYTNVEMITALGFEEIMPVCMSSILGKSKKLDFLYLIRGIHDRRFNHPKFINNIVDPEWSNTIQIFIKTLSKELMNVDGINESRAREEIKKNLNSYIFNSLKTQDYSKHENFFNKIFHRVSNRLFSSNFEINEDNLTDTTKNTPLIREYIKEISTILSIFSKIERSQKQIKK